MDTTPIIAAIAIVAAMGGAIPAVYFTSRRWRKFHARQMKQAGADIDLLAKDSRARGQELAELRAFKYGVESQRKKAAAKGRAAQEAKRQAQKALQDATHADMRRELAELI